MLLIVCLHCGRTFYFMILVMGSSKCHLDVHRGVLCKGLVAFPLTSLSPGLFQTSFLFKPILLSVELSPLSFCAKMSLLSCQTQSVLQDLFFGGNVCVFIYFLVFLLQFFQISTHSVDHSFSAIVLKLDMYTRERNSVWRTKFRRSRSKVKVTRRSNIKINETLSFWVNFIGSSPNLVAI